MENELQRHRRADKCKWVVAFLAIIGLLGCVIALFVKLDRQTTITTLGGEAYEIGLLDAAGKEEKGETAIRTRKGVTVDGFKCEIEDDAQIEYTLFFYDKDGKFISSSAKLTADYSGTGIPGGAETVKIMIVPTHDEDGKVSIFEVLGYANLLTVTFNQ